MMPPLERSPGTIGVVDEIHQERRVWDSKSRPAG